jgi:hypothetical protein
VFEAVIDTPGSGILPDFTSPAITPPGESAGVCAMHRVQNIKTTPNPVFAAFFSLLPTRILNLMSSQ